ncbi:uncharacterized protein HD556DRAFT_1467212 [Suillus plorans]|uniref:Uncharacterized protein n=1 Tax=Suillus plorans TaxID=116603 RepID=A0A9P7IWX8_9AGAM|nr:uncharacterized protein HD556DRAFT_1467212 [Suillus plorans]KAG1796751.1 hypothetical protein HD556DRAFT_1467212 [Suillus plorans]
MKGMDDVVPTIDFSPSGSKEPSYSLKRDDIDVLLQVLGDLESWAQSSSDPVAMGSIQEARSAVDKLITKMDNLEAGFDHIAEHSLLSASRLSSSCRRLTEANKHAFQELAEQLHEMQESQANQENDLQTTELTSHSERERADILEYELHQAKVQIESKVAARRILERCNLELAQDFKKERQNRVLALVDATEQTCAVEVMRQESSQVHSRAEEVKALEARNASKISQLVEEQGTTLQNLEATRSRGENLETQIQTARSEEQTPHLLLVHLHAYIDPRLPSVSLGAELSPEFSLDVSMSDGPNTVVTPELELPALSLAILSSSILTSILALPISHYLEIPLDPISLTEALPFFVCMEGRWRGQMKPAGKVVMEAIENSGNAILHEMLMKNSLPPEVKEENPLARLKLLLIAPFLTMHILNFATTLTPAAISRYQTQTLIDSARTAYSVSHRVDITSPAIASVLTNLAAIDATLQVEVEVEANVSASTDLLVKIAPPLYIRITPPGPVRPRVLFRSTEAIENFMTGWTTLIGDPILSKWIVLVLAVSVALKGIAEGAMRGIRITDEYTHEIQRT